MKVLILGGGYGLLLAGFLHERSINFDIFATPEEVRVLNDDGFIIRGRSQPDLQVVPNVRWHAITELDSFKYDLVVFSMPEGSYKNSGLNDLLISILHNKTPILNVMNIPLPKFVSDTLKCLTNVSRVKGCFSSFSVLNKIPAAQIINASPEPQIYKGPKINEINIRLGGVFRCSNFNGRIKSNYFDRLREQPTTTSLPISIKDYASPWTSVSKWPMLLTGNYRCISEGKIVTIADAVLKDLNSSAAIYNQIACDMRLLGAPRNTIIPFNFYANVAKKLDAPSSVARAIIGGSRNIERVDLLLLKIFSLKGIQNLQLEKISRNIDENIANFSAKGSC